MAATTSSSSYKLHTLATFLCRYRKPMSSGGGRWRSHRDLPLGGGGSSDQGLRLLSVSSKAMNRNEQVQGRPQLPAPPNFGFSNWVRWLLGSVVTFLLPFWKSKWDNFLILEGKAAKVVGEVEVVAEVVEKVATTADKALEELANQLPGNSKLKEAALVLEHISSAAAQDAQIVENIINKVGDVKKDLEDLETIVEPDKIMQGKHSKN